MLKVRADKLMVIAGVVWLLAGVNVAGLGVRAYLQDWGWMLALLIAGSCVVFVAFHAGVFSSMVDKHAKRIYGYGELRRSVFLFFDAKGYVMMGVMMGGGIALRVSGLVPEWFIAFFYTGIGVALALAGVDFLVRYARASHQWNCPLVPSAWRRAE